MRTGCGGCIVPVDGFFEWRATGAEGEPALRHRHEGRQAVRHRIWENWRNPAIGEWIRTFAIITTDANSMVADIHDRMPLILAPEGYARWLGDEPDPADLMRPFPSELMRMWPISTRVNKPENDNPSIVEPVEVAICAMGLPL
jgi:putative SOS response-associated peptidase YedK